MPAIIDIHRFSEDLVDKNHVLHGDPMTRAKTIALFSECKDKQVGALIMCFNEHDTIEVATSNITHCVECRKEKGLPCPAVHAEVAALECLKTVCPAHKSFVIYVTLEPCKDCAEALLKAGCQKVYFENYTNSNKSGLKEWRSQRGENTWIKV